MTQINPIEKSCFRVCSSCYRCADKGVHAKCTHCTGRNDPTHKLNSDDYHDDICRCSEGILQWRTQTGRLIIAKIPGDPFKGNVIREKETVDERDYQAHVRKQREITNNPNWSPIQYEQSRQSADNWYDQYLAGKAE